LLPLTRHKKKAGKDPEFGETQNVTHQSEIRDPEFSDYHPSGASCLSSHFNLPVLKTHHEILVSYTASFSGRPSPPPATPVQVEVGVHLCS
jgi:hypothetical protein